MISTTWAEFLKDHKENEDYNKATVEAATLIDKKTDRNVAFTKLTEAQLLVVVSKSAVGGAAQYLFSFFKLGNSILRKGIQFVAMIKFGKRATILLVDPDTLFNFLSRKEYSPPFAELLRAKMEDDFKELKKNNF